METAKTTMKKTKGKMMFKTINNMGPNSLKELFTFKRKILTTVLVVVQVWYVCQSPIQTVWRKVLCTMELLSGTPTKR